MAKRLGYLLAAMVAWLLFAASPALPQATASYTYDPSGRVITSTTAAGVTTYSYDNADNRTHVTACVSTCNHNPVANADSASVASGGTVVVSVRANDTDADGDTLTVTGVAGGSKGVPSVSGGGTTATYVATAGQSGADSFTYTVSDGHGGSATGTVNITISASIPVANPVSMTVAFNSSGNSAPLSVTGTFTSVAVASGASRGTATASGTGITYTPFTGASGADSFTYTANNSSGTSAPATVSVTVNPAPPSPPTAGPVSATVAFNSSANPISPSLGGGPATSVSIVSGAGHGTATASGLGLTYTPTAGTSGPDSFTYNATGPGGTSSSALVSITVNAGAPALTAGVSPASYSGSRDPNGEHPGAPVTCTGSGGTGPYTYTWLYVSGDSSLAVSGVNFQSVVWSKGGTLVDNSFFAVWRCKVTDSLGATAFSNNVSIEYDEGTFM